MKSGAARIDKYYRLIIEKENIPVKTRFPNEISVTTYELNSQKDSVKTAIPVSCSY
ncbi:MAG: hypothetical protein WCK78_01510 [Paludibacter sp.]